MKAYFLLKTTVQDLSASSGITLSGLAKILALIGTLFAVLNAPSGISQLIGSDLSVSSALQSLQTTMIGTGLLSNAGRMLGSTVKDASALATYGTGRILGGASINQQLNPPLDAINPIVSNRPALGGIQGGIESMNSSDNPGFIDFAAGFIANGMPNIARPISRINAVSGSFRDIMANSSYSSAEKLGRAGLKMTGWGASRAYVAASARVSSFGHRKGRSKRGMTQINSMMFAGIRPADSSGGRKP